MLRTHRHDCLTVVLPKNRECKTIVFLTALIKKIESHIFLLNYMHQIIQQSAANVMSAADKILHL